MANLAATDWVVTILEEWIKSGKRHILGRLALPDSTKTYVDNGIPLPALGLLGFQRQLDSLQIIGRATSQEATPLAVTVTLDAVAGSITAGTHSYKVGFVTPDGLGLPSAVSNVITSVPADHGKVTIPRPAGYTSRATGWNVYRTVAGDTGNWKLVNASPVAIGTATYQDNIADASLGADAPTLDVTEAEYLVQYDKTNHKLFLFVEEAVAAGGPPLEAGATEVPGPRTWDYLAVGW